MRRVFLLVLVLALVPAGVVLARAVMAESRQVGFPGVDAPEAVALVTATLPPLDPNAAAERFAGALRFPTISHGSPQPHDTAAFQGLHRYLAATYPMTHEALTVEAAGEGGLSLLYTWEGRSADRLPVMLMGHLDVVPVVPGTERDWTHPPFAGRVAGGYVWGRGAMDDKSSVTAILEAVERMVRAGFQPERTVYLAFGHDEEVGGDEGAARIAELLESRGVSRYAMVLDEGGAMTANLVPGVEGVTAIVGVQEKGYASIDLIARADGGHSSTPPRTTAIGILAQAITRLEEDPFPVRMDGGGLTLLDYLAPEMPFGQRAPLTNRWLFDPLLARLLSASPETDAMLRTTTAATIARAGVKDNVLPVDATATVNFRIIPGETVESVIERVRTVVDDDRIELRLRDGARDPSPRSDFEGPEFRMLAATIRSSADGPVHVAPYLVMGGTDAKHYADRSDAVFRFLAAQLEEGDLVRIHGTNERLSVRSLAQSIHFFERLIQSVQSLP